MGLCNNTQKSGAKLSSAVELQQNMLIAIHICELKNVIVLTIIDTYTYK